MLCVNGIRVQSTTTDVRFAELQQLCEAADDKASLAFGMAGMLPVHALHGRVREASQLASEYMTLAESIGDPTLTVMLASVALAIKMETGPIADALRWAQDSIDLSEGNPILEPMAAAAFSVRGSARWAQGRSRVAGRPRQGNRHGARNRSDGARPRGERDILRNRGGSVAGRRRRSGQHRRGVAGRRAIQ